MFTFDVIMKFACLDFSCVIFHQFLHITISCVFSGENVKIMLEFLLFIHIAVKVADKMQKEVTAKRSLVDTLQSKVRWLEDQIDTLIKVGIMHWVLSMILKIEVSDIFFENQESLGVVLEIFSVNRSPHTQSRRR